jgi:antitoxin VapB
VIAPSWLSRPPPGIERFVLVEDELGVFCGKNHVCARSGSVAPEGGSGHAWISPGATSPFDQPVTDGRRPRDNPLVFRTAVEEVREGHATPYTYAISHLAPIPMSITSVFTNNRSQAVRLPADVRLPEGVKKVQVRARGVDRIISPVGHTWDEFFLNGPKASDDFLVERASQQQPERESL